MRSIVLFSHAGRDTTARDQREAAGITRRHHSRFQKRLVNSHGVSRVKRYARSLGSDSEKIAARCPPTQSVPQSRLPRALPVLAIEPAQSLPEPSRCQSSVVGGPFLLIQSPPE